MPDHAELVRDALDAFFCGDPQSLRDRLAPDAEWVWHRPSRYDCHGRDEILATLDDRRRREILTEVVEARSGRDNMVLVRWGGPGMEPRFEVPGGVASIVATLGGDHVTSIRDCTGHADALTLTGLADPA